jgi:hypothetical protein
MRMYTILVVAVALASIVAGSALASDAHAKDNATAEWMIKQEGIWANMACGGKWIALDVLADDFQGTSPNGEHYVKPKSVPTNDPNTKWSTDCRLDKADVRFFSSDVAVVYGAESKTAPLSDSKHERRCLVWTDTWLKRNGKWQMIAVQDNRIKCPTK